MNSSEIRATFLGYFAGRDHKIVPSSSLVPDDPTLLLTNAGMVQFKPYFLGQKPVAFPRAASVQKCFREIDLEIVGKTARHLTFFEMLGNFSFGDYFKKEACTWAWELMKSGFGLPEGRLWATVYEEDEEAAKIWEQEVGVPPERILRRSRAEGNFWDMGVAGPCGPCSEILYDRGEKFGRPYTDGNLDEDRYLEVWNLVFMQHLQNERGEIVGDLPSQNVDTGMGLERIASILQNVASNFEIDTMAPILEKAQEMTGHRYGAGENTDIGLRVLTEHSRAMTFLLADGVFPGNVGRGYVLRRLIRRAVRHARLMGVENSVLPRMTEEVVGVFGAAYPELSRNLDLIRNLVSKEESSFDQTLQQGLKILETEIERIKGGGGSKLPGDLVFKLHDTFGFPLDLTNDIAADEGLKVDQNEFEKLMTDQRKRARAARTEVADAPKELALTDVAEVHGRTEFAGYENLSLDAAVWALLQGIESRQVLTQGSRGQVVLSATPFYPEGGGQVGDKGDIRTPSGLFRVDTTNWGIPGVVVHSGHVVAGEIRAGEEARATVDPAHRDGVTKSHSATHMLHWALRDAVGQHARQQGSLVEPGRLRFDFSHYEPLSPDMLAKMEEELNQRVLWDDSVRAYETTYDYAMSIGAMALFGEKYGDHVRVVEVGDYSKELCGGTHVRHTGQIGVVKLVREGSVAAGIRRVEALTGLAGLNYLNSRVQQLNRAAEILKADPENLADRLEKTLQTMKSMEAEIDRLRDERLRRDVAAILASDAVEQSGSYNIVALHRDGVSGEEARKLVQALTKQLRKGLVIVGSAGHGKGTVVAGVGPELSERGVSAVELLQPAKSILGGGGGGKPELAIAGGPNAPELRKALEATAAAGRRALEEL